MIPPESVFEQKRDEEEAKEEGEDEEAAHEPEEDGWGDLVVAGQCLDGRVQGCASDAECDV